MDHATPRVEAPLSDEGQRLFDLFRRPQGRSRPRPGERAAMEGARWGRLTVGDTAVVTYRWGDGARPVLLVHGWESRASRYAKVVTRLLELGYSPLAFDAPGHGESDGDSTTLTEYRDAIGQLHEAHGPFEAVVAHSFGVTASFLALRDGVRARRVVAISSVPDFGYVVDAFCAHTGLTPRLRDELRHRIERDLYPGEADPWARFSVLTGVADPRPPLLLVHDEDDEAVGPEQARRIAAAYGERARTLTTRRFGHRRILGSPQLVAAVGDFVSTGAVSGGLPGAEAAR
ncbi:alpha/beta hydrolase [Streptomyces buecherae]|uniref:alpha/beta hydrolase n=2 Tax=Streptomyces buecherae TaxID=2763006 RepID=UPI001C27A86C|nr:alpha/beta hydrolase [Streptomyces buecherae]